MTEKTDSKTQNTALEKKTEHPMVAYLDTIIPKLEKMATKHLDARHLIQVFLGDATRNPKLLQCTKQSIVAALSLCAQTGLAPGGTLGLAYLIPRRNRHNNNQYELNFQPGYRGFAAMARRSGEVKRINAAPIYSWEMDGRVVNKHGEPLFEYTNEPPKIRHDMSSNTPDKNDKDIVGGYAVAELEGGQRVQCWLSRDQIEKRRKKGSSTGGVWKEWYPEMVRKTMLRALLNGGLVPIATTSELALAMANDPDDWRNEEFDTRSSRHTAAYAPAGATVETTAEVVEPGQQDLGELADEVTADPAHATAHVDPIDYFELAQKMAKQMGASEKEFNAAIQALEDIPPPPDWDEAIMDLVINKLEDIKGA